MNTRTFSIGVLLGLVLTVLTLVVAYPCCLNGPARGLPFPVWLPRCEATGFRVSFDRIGSAVHVVDLVRGTADVALWGGLVVGVQCWLKRRRAIPA